MKASQDSACSYLLHNSRTNVPSRSLRKDRVSKRVLLVLALDFGGLRKAGFFLAEAEEVVGSGARFVGVVFVVVGGERGAGFLLVGVPAFRTEGVGAAGEVS